MAILNFIVVVFVACAAAPLAWAGKKNPARSRLCVLPSLNLSSFIIFTLQKMSWKCWCYLPLGNYHCGSIDLLASIFLVLSVSLDCPSPSNMNFAAVANYSQCISNATNYNCTISCSAGYMNPGVLTCTNTSWQLSGCNGATRDETISW